MDGIKFEMTKEQFFKIASTHLEAIVSKSFEQQKPRFKEGFDNFFKNKDWTFKSERFQDGYDWAIEEATRKGIQRALIELNFEEQIYQKAMEILSDGEFVKEMAKDKLKSILKFNE